ncbi:MAG: M42 family metallopeptidase [Phycisphaerae bacterium]|nr:M42 family metallopeptidase [Phycisphaerae bacterium]
MRAESQEFLFQLLETPSPSGFEQPVQRIIRKRMKPLADQITPDVHGNTVVALNPKGSPRVMLAGHVDQIGFMVRYISDEGYLYFGPIGGIDATVVPGLSLVVHTAKGPVEGVVGRKAIHLMKPEERNNAKVDLNELWLDIGAKDKKEAARRVEIGDPITYRLGATKLGRDLVASPGMDDKVGAFVVMEALRLIKQSSRKCRCAVFSVATVQEELGLRGARTSCFGVDPLVGIAVDVTHSADYPGADKKVIGDLAVGKGPVVSIGPNINPVVGRLLMATGRKKKVPYQREGEPRATGTDANAIQISRSGVAAGLVSIPNRYMHTPVEVVSLSDLENAAKLLAETCLEITTKTDFVPK